MTLPMKKLRTQKSGFTLVELLVVIVIIGVLASITFTGANFLLGAQEEKAGGKSDRSTFPRFGSIQE